LFSGLGKRETLVWYLLPFPSFTSPFCSFSSLSSPLLPCFPFLPYVPSLSRGFLPQIQLRSLRRAVNSPSGSGQSHADIQFLVHSELKIAHPAIALLHKFTDHHACIVICTGPCVPYWYGVSQKRSVGMFWSRPRKCRYGNTSSHACYSNITHSLHIYNTLAVIFQVKPGLEGWLTEQAVGTLFLLGNSSLTN